MNEDRRFYRNKYPEEEDSVMVRVNTVEDIGAYVSLLEYGGIEGMIALSELTKRKIRSLNKVLQVGNVEAVAVLSVDKEKGYIDLSKRKLLPHEIEECKTNYANMKSVFGIVNHVSKSCPEIEWEDFMERTMWKLDDEYGSCYDAFKLSISEKPEIWDLINLPIEIKEELKRQVELKLKPKKVKIQQDFDITCDSYEGINGIKYALKGGLEESNENFPFKINLIASPKYKMWINSADIQNTINKFGDIIDIIKVKIEEKGGKLELNKEAYVTDIESELE